MKKIFLFLLLLTSGAALRGQTTATFENFGLSPGSYLNGSDGSGGFASGNVFLPNKYDAQFQFWTGWAVSSTTDTTTPGFLNEFSAIAGGGYGGSATYAVAYASFGGSVLYLEGAAEGGYAEGMWVTNSTYAYLSMLNGDAYAKKFGGITGDDPDYFLLTVKKYLGGTLGPDSIDLYLADYRFGNNSEDYILDEWTWLDLSPLGNADSLHFNLTSSDVGAFGMNTPAYFCIDDLHTADGPLGVKENGAAPAIDVFPNPSPGPWTLRTDLSENEPIDIRLYDLNGRLVRSWKEDGTGEITLENPEIVPGLYLLELSANSWRKSLKVSLVN